MQPTDAAPAQVTARPRVRMVDGLPVPIPPEGREWLTVVELADALEVAPARVRHWAAVGVSVGEIGSRKRVLLQRCRVGGRAVRFYPEAVLTFLRQTSASTAEASLPAPIEGDESRNARLAAVDAELASLGL